MHKQLSENKKKGYSKSLKALDASFSQYKHQYGQAKTKLDYCKQFDDNYKSIVENKIKLLDDTFKLDKYLQRDFIDD